MKETTSRTTLDFRGNFHDDGLFSTIIYGPIGSPERQETFSYIKLNTTLISPVLFGELTKLSGFYAKIVEGTTFAKWNDKTKEFEESDFSEGDTGFSFFLKHIKDIKWKKTSSKKRDQKIEMLKKYENELFLEHFVVLPAGVRDYVVKDGKGTEDEINAVYRKLMSYSSLLENQDGYSKVNDLIRFKMQRTLQEIYEYIYAFSEGKNGYIQNLWTKRSIKDGTRNVITASVFKVNDLRDGKSLTSNDSLIGVFQFAKGISSKLDFVLRSKFIAPLLGNGVETKINLINPKTGRFELVNVPEKAVSKYMSVDGLESMIVNKLRILDYSFNPVMVGKYHLCNIYDDGKRVKPMLDNNLPDGFDWKHVRPMTLTEIIVLSTLDVARDAIGIMTRFPITQQGSIYPTRLHVRTTVKSRSVILLDDMWGEGQSIKDYPILGQQLYTSMAVHHSKLGNLGGDHDGDKLNLTILLTKEAIAEAIKLLRNRTFYIQPDGEWVDRIENAISSFVLKHINKVGNKESTKTTESHGEFSNY